MFCKNCGEEIADNTMFCPKCGGQVNQSSNPVNQAPQGYQPYGGPQYGGAPYQGVAKGRVLLLISGIFSLIGGIITVIGLFSTLGQMSYLGTALSWLGINAGMFYAYVVFSFVAAGILLATGVLAVMHAGRKEKADLLFKCGIAVVALRIIDWIWGSAIVAGIVTVVTPVSVILGLIFPALLIAGAFMNKNS